MLGDKIGRDLRVVNNIDLTITEAFQRFAFAEHTISSSTIVAALAIYC